MTGTQSQRAWYRSLDELADTPEFRALVEKEFPGQSAELDASPLARRTFLQLMAASLGLAGMAGCRRPELEILPYNKQPAPVVVGLPTFYATALPRPGGALPVLVECHQGRPTKIEGNPLYEPTGGATDATAQAAILDLYDPDRARQVLHKSEPSTWEALDDFARVHIGKLIADGGAGLRLLLPWTISPATVLVLEDLLARAPDARVYRWDPMRRIPERLLIEQADVIVAIDSDILGGAAGSTANLKAFAARRKAQHEGRPPLRLYVIEPVYTVTGGAADHRLSLSQRECESFVAALTLALNPQAPGAEHQRAIAAGLSPVAQVWVEEIAADLRKAGRRSLICGGGGPMLDLAESLRSYGVTHDMYVGRDEALDSPLVERGQGELADLTAELLSGAVDTLVIVGGNPVYDAPGALSFAAALQKAKHTVRLGMYDDETAALCEWRVPLAHSLESWDDAETPEGYYAVAQPVIAPLFGGRSSIEALARLTGHKTPAAYELVRLSYQRQTKGGSDTGFKQALHDGFVRGSRAERVELESASGSPAAEEMIAAHLEGRAKNRAAEKTTPASIELLLTTQSRVGNGALANNGWLQELADPVTKLVWTNALLISPSLATELGIAAGDVVKVALGEKSLTVPAWIQPGQAARTVSIDLGYGRTRAGRIGNGVGVDAYPLLGWSTDYDAEQAEFQNVKLEKTGEHVDLACTQNHWSMEGRDLIREERLGEPAKAHAEHGHAEKAGEHGHDAAHAHNEGHGHAGHGQLNIVEPPALDGKHQWGMVIDLNACIGCGACELACQAENNIPIVGADEVRRGRLMHWLRLDRYFSGPVEDPRMAHQPVACVHCENAPCEIVCPVNATVHSPEGLNLQVYNRCIGTRYCSNNCPYKARRFNWFDYHGRALGELRLGPLADYGVPETQKMHMNPDVTVRMRGVMEKCNYCIQRIERGKLGAKLASDGPTYHLADGTVTPACAQSCAAQAIVFGDLADKTSRVSKLKADQRHYDLLGELNTRPRTSYLARVRNVNPLLEKRLAQLQGTAD